MATLLDILPNTDDLLALEPEELAGILLEVLPGMMQSAGVVFSRIEQDVYPPLGPGGYDRMQSEDVSLVLAEALSWLETQGLVVKNPDQPQHTWYVITRRGRRLRTRADVETYRLGRALPVELLQPVLVDKVHSLFLRGDYDTAVFQAFKTVELAIRDLMPECPGDLPAQALVRKAFHPETGKLTDDLLVSSEKQAMSDLFAGAMGHGKNPPSHRDVNHTKVVAARLIVFARHLHDIVQTRAIFM